MSVPVRRCFRLLPALVLVTGLLAGCWGSSGTDQNATSDSGAPSAQDSAGIELPSTRPSAGTEASPSAAQSLSLIHI